MSIEKKRNTPSVEHREEKVPYVARNAHSETMNLTQIQKLVHLLDRGDIAEIELNRADEGLRLVLRKLKAPERSKLSEAQYIGTRKHITPTDQLDQPTTLPNSHCLKAQMVGVFHPWLKPHGKVLATVGDFVKVGQIVGTIEALSILNEIETTVAGRVVAVSIQDGQPVEYGQPLLTIDSSGGETV
jgi:acetyl-CoA carboxylase biotin carboxyl carrier protein